MTTTLLGINLALMIVVLIVLLASRSKKDAFEANERRIKEEMTLMRQELNNSLQSTAEQLLRQFMALNQANEQRMETSRTTMETIRREIEQNLLQIRQNNEKKLEEMRLTVDEKLSQNLEKRLGESFRQVSERLEKVHQGLGEMQTLASGVGDLKKIFSNVKTRGIWGEVQLGSILEQMLTIDQYDCNVATKPSQPNNRVEYAIRLPGKNENQIVYLPIDAKFPLEDYQVLLQAQQDGDATAAQLAGRALEQRVKSFAKDVQEKYLQPPHTTDFAVLFVPLEGLYSELLQRPGLSESLQQDYRVMLAGPTTISALLNSLQMGFRTLAIEKRADEVWQLLGAVKTGFAGFGQLLDKTQKKLSEASHTIEDASRKTRTIERKLRQVSQLSQSQANHLIGEEDLEQDIAYLEEDGENQNEQ